MRFILTVALSCLLTTCFSQKTALFDRNFEKPILFTDSVTVEQAVDYFPVQVKDFDTLYASFKYLADLLNKRQRSKLKSFEFKAGNSTIKTEALPYAYGDRYKIRAYFNMNGIEAKWKITKNKNNKHNSRNLKEIMTYMETNKSWFRSPFEITPKFYNIIVVTY